MRWPRSHYILMCKHAKIGNWLHQRFAYLFIMYFDDDDTNSIQYIFQMQTNENESTARKNNHLAFGSESIYNVYASLSSLTPVKRLCAIRLFDCTHARSLHSLAYPFSSISIYFRKSWRDFFAHCCSSCSKLNFFLLFDHTQNSLFHGHQSNDLIEQMYCLIA